VSQSVWRLIPLLEAPGAVHMALDEWLLDQHQHHSHPPTLRFYTWNPPAISLGVSQRQHIPTHWPHLTWQGRPIDIVQRPTGGRGVLHQGDLTYAVIISDVVGSREQVYRFLCQFLIEGWRLLGIELGFGGENRHYLKSPHCFGLATPADLVTTAGTKLIGSAQLRRGQAILQHGSMVLNPDPALYEQVFQTPAPASLPAISSISDIVAQLTEAAARHFGCQLQPQPLTPAEWQSITAKAAIDQ